MPRQLPEDVLEHHLGNARLKVRCTMCRQVYTLDVQMQDYQRYREGAMVQDAFPYLSAGQRELLISGLCDTCWDYTFREKSENTRCNKNQIPVR